MIQLMLDDIAPSIPTCTLPGQQGSAYIDPLDDDIDTAAVISTVIEETFEGVDLPKNVSIVDLIDAAMPS